MAEDRLILRKELGLILKVQGDTLTKWVKEGKLPPYDTTISRRTTGWKLSTLVNAGVAIPA
jgi:hypothetical protein